MPLLSSFCSPHVGHPVHLHSFPTRRSSDLFVTAYVQSVPPPVPPRTHGKRHLQACSNPGRPIAKGSAHKRSEEHTSELQSLTNLVCRLLLEKKKQTILHKM